jgi:signal transduction histidine kinase/CheY-like chemotaxis protein/HPt (histidine-containing phosphotransfer) domain-containing protein
MFVSKVAAAKADRAATRETPSKHRETIRLLTMAERLADFGHWHLDPAEGTIELSEQARMILGVGPAATLTPRGVLRLFAAPARRQLIEAIRNSHDPNVSCTVSLGTGNRLRHLTVQIQSDSGPFNESFAFFGVLRDITDKLGAEQKLVVARDDARAATLAKSEFLATMSHEIRTPMTGVMGMIDLLQSGPTEEERDRYLGAMKQSAELLMSVLDGILDFSKVESGKMELVCRNFDLEALAERTVDMFQNAASKKGLLFDLRVNSGRSPIVRGDPLRIQQVVSNLISNAVKFTEHGRITLTVRASAQTEDEQSWRIEVRDTGIGIDEAELAQLFEPFVQIGNRRCGGTGLGLAISRRLVETMGGKTGVTSTPGHGSTFWFEITLPIAAAAEARIEDIVPGATPGRSLHVLIAEDNVINQMLISAMVRRLGHRVSCVDDGRQAVEASKAASYDCILMDMQMPDMDGIAATRAIRSGGGADRSIPIIALTADAAPERRRFYDNIGLTGFMTKPLNAEELRRHLSQVAAAVEIPQPASTLVQNALETERVAELRMILGQSKFLAVVRLLTAELIEAPAEIRRCAMASDSAGARARAHSLKGAAANFGAALVARSAMAVELALPGPELELALGRLDEECARTREPLLDLVNGDREPQRQSA